MTPAGIEQPKSQFLFGKERTWNLYTYINCSILRFAHYFKPGILATTSGAFFHVHFLLGYYVIFNRRFCNKSFPHHHASSDRCPQHSFIVQSWPSSSLQPADVHCWTSAFPREHHHILSTTILLKPSTGFMSFVQRAGGCPMLRLLVSDCLSRTFWLHHPAC